MTRWRQSSPPEHEVQRLVGGGYDLMGERFDRWADLIEGSPRQRHLGRLVELVPEGGRVLEIGCGSGARSTSALAGRHDLIGIDLSARQIERARARIPAARFLVADATEVEFRPGSFDAVVALYSMNHVPTWKHATLYERLVAWLRPGGWFLASLGTSGSGDGIEDGWLGVPMFFASLDADVNLVLMREAGLTIETSELVAETEPPTDDGPATSGDWQWVLARRPSAD